MHTPVLPQTLGWESQGSPPDPGRDREVPREKQSSPGSCCSGVLPPALQPQCPLGSPQPSQPRAWGGLRGQLFPRDAAELGRSPPNTTSLGLGGVFWGASPLQGSKTPFRATGLARAESPWGLYHSSEMFPSWRAGAEREGEPAPGWATRGLTLGWVPLGEQRCHRSHGHWPPQNSFLSSSTRFMCRGCPCPPSLLQLARLFHLKEKEREGKK